MRKLVAVPIVALGVVLLTGSSAFAHQCTNANRSASAHYQVVLGDDGEPVSATQGFIKRAEKGLLGAEGERFHGVLGLDFDGDGVADFHTFIVGPNGEVPQTAQENGSPDHGIVNICTVLGC